MGCHLAEEAVQREGATRASFTEQDGDFEQSDGADGDGFAAADSFPEVSAVSRSPASFTLPDQAPSGDFQAGGRAGVTVASGRPRLVMVIEPLPTPSSKDRHLALNSVMLTTRWLTAKLRQCSLWSDDQIRAGRYFLGTETVMLRNLRPPVWSPWM